MEPSLIKQAQRQLYLYRLYSCASAKMERATHTDMRNRRNQHIRRPLITALCLANSNELSSSLEAAIRSVTQEFPSILRELKVRFLVHKQPATGSYHEPEESNPHNPILYLRDSYLCVTLCEIRLTVRRFSVAFHTGNIAARICTPYRITLKAGTNL
jgi:hypothetical protein